MYGLNQKLAKLAQDGKQIQVGIVGAGQMGKGLVSQIGLMKGMRATIVSDIRIESAKASYIHAGIPEDMIVEVSNASDADRFLKQGKYLITQDSDIVSQIGTVEAVVDATGVPEVGAKVAMNSIMNGKHIIMLNVETDVVIGPWLKKQADSAGVVYSGTAGDEPGAVRELYDFADALGFDIVAIGKGKNNKVDYTATPDSVREDAIARGVAPHMLCAFCDGTKTMVEMTAMSNSMNYVPDVRGGYGIKAVYNDLKDVVPNKFRLKSDGGMLNQLKVVDYIDGIAPGVFIIVTSRLPEVLGEMKYLKMGEGPNFVLYRPYHMCSLETPISIAMAVLNKQCTIAPDYGMVSETITVAKRDLAAGEYLDGIGGFTVYGTIERADVSKQINALPLGLITKKTNMKNSVKKGQIITYADVNLDDDSLVFQLRKLQDKFIK